ncbi:hypothetical protein, partial [Oligoflexus sp.]|uniref:hypothetical protein n=1 Tax=Oligoflexus sp. TaxID=1971216 RepID=UPI002D786E79
MHVYLGERHSYIKKRSYASMQGDCSKKLKVIQSLYFDSPLRCHQVIFLGDAGPLKMFSAHKGSEMSSKQFRDLW